MVKSETKCMVCAKVLPILEGGVCESCSNKIRREAMGEQARDRQTAS
jgi:hypothetical protein